jgi:hypothetical protein
LSRISVTSGAYWSVEDEADEVGVVEDVRQFVRHVPEVDVDRDRPQLEAAEHRLDPLVAVLGVDADVVAHADALGSEVVGDAVRSLVEVAKVRRVSRSTRATRSGTASTTCSNRSAML